MSKIDHYFGTIVLTLLLPLHLIQCLVGRRNSNPVTKPLEVRNIFISKYFGMGSILLATPMIRGLKSHFKNARITFVTFDQNRSFCQNISEVDRIITFDRSNFFKFTRDVFRFFFSFHKPDIFMDLEFYCNFPLIIIILSLAKLRMAFVEKQLMRRLYTTIPVYFNYRRHITEIFANYAIYLGAPKFPLDDYSQLKFNTNDLKKAESLADNFNEIVLVNPNASELSDLRKWPGEYFKYVIQHLLTKPDRKVLLIGGKEDFDTGEDILSGIEGVNVENLSGKLSLNETFALLSIADLLVTNDSGPLHWAAALGTKTVGLFGPETPELYGHSGEKHFSFYKGIYCSPCMNILYNKITTCRDNQCLKQIPPQAVLTKVYEMLRQPNEASTTFQTAVR